MNSKEQKLSFRLVHKKHWQIWHDGQHLDTVPYKMPRPYFLGKRPKEELMAKYGQPVQESARAGNDQPGQKIG